MRRIIDLEENAQPCLLIDFLQTLNVLLEYSTATVNCHTSYTSARYASSGLYIRPKSKLTKIERLKIFAESLDLNPELATNL